MALVAAALAIAVGAFAPSAVAQTGPAPIAAVPDALRPWVEWALRDQPYAACSRLAGQASCVWPHELELDLDEAGGRFALGVEVEVASWVALPGDARTWPRDVSVDGAAAVVSAENQAPRVWVERGQHRLTGGFAWRRLPESLAVPPSIARVALRLGGEAVPLPRREPTGALWLRATAAEQGEAASLDVEVWRRFEDGAPLRVETRLRLRVGGDPREVDLGDPRPAGFTAWRLESPLPARLDETGHLRVQLRPGEWQISVHAASLDAPASVEAALPVPPWPDAETWVVVADEALRTVRVDGVAAVDPARTTLPPEWQGAPAFSVRRGDVMSLEESRRGQPTVMPPAIDVERTMWLARGGTGWLARDVVSVEAHDALRLAVATPWRLDRAEVDGVGQVITEQGGAPGVELRTARPSLTAELSVDGRGAEVPAAAWGSEVRSLRVTMHLPPGYDLIAVTGPDDASDAWIQRWTLYDLFLLLLGVVVVGRMYGVAAAVGYGLVVGLSWHEPGAVKTLWLVALVTFAIARALPDGWLRGLIRAAWGASAAALLVATVAFAWREVRVGLFPVLEGGDPQSYVYDSRGSFGFKMGGVQEEMATAAFEQAMYGDAVGGGAVPEQEAGYAPGAGDGYDGSVARSVMLRSAAVASPPPEPPSRAAPVDPDAIVQAGQGLPRWTWRTHFLTWSGPLGEQETFRVWLVSPQMNLLLALARAVGVLALLALFVRRAPPAGRTGGPAVVFGRRDGGSPGPATPGGGDTSTTSSGSAAYAGSGPADDAAPTAEGSPVGDSEAHDADATPPNGHAIPPRSAGLVLSVLLALGGLLVPQPAAATATIPDAAALGELRSWLLRPPPCGERCVETARLALRADASGLTIDAEVHAAAPTSWRLPGPDAVWMPSVVTVDGMAATAMARDAAGFLYVRVPAGVHRVEASGPASPSSVLQLGDDVRVMAWEVEGWTLDGFREDGPPPATVQLRRVLDEAAGVAGFDTSSSGVTALLRVTRDVSLEGSSTVTTTVERWGPADESVVVRVPLIDGERVVASDAQVDGAAVVVKLPPGTSSYTWTSRLDAVEALKLQAPRDVTWVETWHVSCWASLSCTFDGLTPSSRLDGDMARVTWHPRPGEQVDVRSEKLAAAAGVSLVIDHADVEITAGRRTRSGVLRVDTRATRGGEHTFVLPVDAQLTSFEVNGVTRPASVTDGRLSFGVEPGSHQVVVGWQEAVAAGVLDAPPSIDLGVGAANVRVAMSVPDNRWVIWTGRATWGPVVRFWELALSLVLVAWVLRRMVPAPLGVAAWFFLGLGMTQTGAAAPLVVVAWFAALAYRERWAAAAPRWLHNLAQLALVLLTWAVVVALFDAVAGGLALRPPSMRVDGGGSSDAYLVWTEYGWDAVSPSPSVVWLPIWAWRAAMLLWSGWLAFAVTRWAQWAWRSFTAGGAWRRSAR